MDLKIGADPELFVSRNNEPLSAYGMIPGTKTDPHKVEKGAVQVDGTALEINIDPATSPEEFSGNINHVLGQLRAMIPREYTLDMVPSVRYPDGYMAQQPEKARELGCDPDFNGYTMEENPPVNAEMAGDVRVAGGHVHVGWGEDYDVRDEHHFQSCGRLAKQLDFYLGLPSLLLDKDNSRRALYGKAGAFRPKSYGMEYRTLSNFWIKSPELQRFVFDQTKLAFHKLAVEHKEHDEKYKRSAAGIINENDFESAPKYIDALGLVKSSSRFKSLLRQEGWQK